MLILPAAAEAVYLLAKEVSNLTTNTEQVLASVHCF